MDCFADVLGLEVGIDDNFFNLGIRSPAGDTAGEPHPSRAGSGDRHSETV
jgi:hypothetical protein